MTGRGRWGEVVMQEESKLYPDASAPNKVVDCLKNVSTMSGIMIWVSMTPIPTLQLHQKGI